MEVSIDKSLAKFGLAVIAIDDLVAVLEQADLFTHWFGPSVKSRERLDSIISDVNEQRRG